MLTRDQKERVALRLKAHENALREIIVQVTGSVDELVVEAIKFACENLNDAESDLADEI